MSHEGLRDCLIWLESALNCKNFKWDAEQHAAARDSLHRGVKEMWKLDAAQQQSSEPEKP